MCCSTIARPSTSPAATWRSGKAPSRRSADSIRSSAPPGTTSTCAGGCWRPARIYHGVWGSAPFQSLYEPAPSVLAFLPQMPEWHLLTATLWAMAGLSLVYEPLKVAVPLAVAALLPPIAQATLSATRASFPEASRRIGRLKRVVVTAFLHLLQPLARLAGRLRAGTPEEHTPELQSRLQLV